jgi:hypothetical protein
MVAARSKNDFMYIIERDGAFNLFSHSPGAPGGGRKQFPKNEKYSAVISKLADMADSLYLVEFDSAFDVYGVMFSAEEGILSMFPGEDRDGDGDMEFVIPGQTTAPPGAE